MSTSVKYFKKEINTRKKTHQQGYAKFEKTVNLLLSMATIIEIENDTIQFDLRTGMKQQDPSTYASKNGGHKFEKVQLKQRENGKKSIPDAELIELPSSKMNSKQKVNKKYLKIVVDAKFYTSQLLLDPIQKIIDDTQLRCDEFYDAFGLIVCIEQTQLDQYKEGIKNNLWSFGASNFDKAKDRLLLVKLTKTFGDSHFLDQVMQKNKDMIKDEILVEYLSSDNLRVIRESLKEIAIAHKNNSAYFRNKIKFQKFRDDSDIRKQDFDPKKILQIDQNIQIIQTQRDKNNYSQKRKNDCKLSKSMIKIKSSKQAHNINLFEKFAEFNDQIKDFNHALHMDIPCFEKENLQFGPRNYGFGFECAKPIFFQSKFIEDKQQLSERSDKSLKSNIQEKYSKNKRNKFDEFLKNHKSKIIQPIEKKESIKKEAQEKIEDINNYESIAKQLHKAKNPIIFQEICKKYDIQVTKVGQINKRLKRGKEVLFYIDKLQSCSLKEYEPEKISEKNIKKSYSKSFNAIDAQKVLKEMEIKKNKQKVDYNDLQNVLNRFKNELTSSKVKLLKDNFPLKLNKDQKPDMRNKINKLIFKSELFFE